MSSPRSLTTRVDGLQSFPRPVSRVCTVETLLVETATPADYARGDLSISVRSVAAPEHAGAGSLAFVQSEPELARTTAASVVVTVEPFLPAPALFEADRCWIAVADPRRWFAKALQSLFPASDASISETAVIAASSNIGAGVHIGPYCVIEEHVVIGDRTRLGSHVTVHERCHIGADCIVEDHTAVGAPGLAYYRAQDTGWYNLPHLGVVVIGNSVRIGAHCAIVRGILLDTVVESGVKIGNFVNVGHNTTIGENSWISSGVTICGRVVVERNVQIAACASIRNKITIGEDAHIGLGTVVTKNVPAKVSIFGVPGRPLPTMREL